MKPTLKLVLISIVLTFLGVSCKNSIIIEGLSDDVPEQENEENKDGEKIFIVDRTGKRWDVTHAVRKYGFEPDKFEYGLGPNAIPPILSPQMLSSGEEGYPSDNESFIVMGVSLKGHTRAYPLTVMTQHEVVDEQFADMAVAVTY
jgi:hypothetical protein